LDTTQLEARDIKQFLKYTLEISDIVREMHSNEIVHRDIKPENILFNEGKVLLSDFGFAKRLQASKEIMMSLKCTPGYCAPEIMLGKGYTKKADVFSISRILCTIVGQLPNKN
jgi:serine/threonine protein kinase